MLDKYLALLERTTHPLNAFDALFGISSIALANPDLCISLTRELVAIERRHMTSVDGSSPYFALAYADALKTIAAAGTGETPAHHRPKSEVRGLGERAAFLTDPAAFTSDGRLVGFSMIPSVLAVRKEDHYPTAAVVRREGGFSTMQVATRVPECLDRRWRAYDCSLIYRTPAV